MHAHHLLINAHQCPEFTSFSPEEYLIPESFSVRSKSLVEQLQGVITLDNTCMYIHGRHHQPSPSSWRLYPSGVNWARLLFPLPGRVLKLSEN